MSYKLKTFLIVIITVSVVLAAAGFMAKILHWPGGNLVFLTGAIAALSSYGFWIFKTSEGYYRYLRLIVLSLWFIVILLSFFRIIKGLIFPMLIPFIWVALEGIIYVSKGYDKTTTRSHKILDILLIVGAIFMVAGMIFTIMHWPGGKAYLIFGLALCCIYALRLLFKRENE